MRVILAVAVLLLGASCGGGPCASPYTGHWVDAALGTQMDLGGDCSFKYSGNGCNSQGTYAAPLASSGTVEINVASTSGGNCLPVGMYACVYQAASSTALAFNCGAGAEQFGR